MYCPNCNKEYEGRFCPECGTKLIEKTASEGGLNLNLGDANAINGGIELYDSHEIKNENHDNRGQINIQGGGSYHVTTVQAQKSELEIIQEKKNIYLTECKRAYEDGILEQFEANALEECRIKLGLDKATANSILESVRLLTERNAKKTSLTPVAKTKLKIFSSHLQNNDVQALLEQMEGIEVLVNKFEDDELYRKYFLALAALQPEKCLEMKEKSNVDNYWKSFWSYIAYLKLGRKAEAEEILLSLSRFPDFPEDNATILAVAGALLKNNRVEAKEYLNAITGEYSTSLQRFVDSIYLLEDPAMAKEMSVDANSCAFYLANIFEQEDPREVARREAEAKAKAEEEARKRAAEEKKHQLLEIIHGIYNLKKRQEEEERKRAEEEQKRKEEAARKRAEEARLVAFEAAKAKAIEEARLQTELEIKQKEEDPYRKALEEHWRKCKEEKRKIEEARLKKEAEAKEKWEERQLKLAERKIQQEKLQAEREKVEVDERAKMAEKFLKKHQNNAELQAKKQKEEERKRQAEEMRQAEEKQRIAQARQKKTYILSITKINNPMLAALTVRDLLGWDVAESKDKFSKLPIKIEKKNESDAKTLLHRLRKGGMFVSANCVNGLGEITKNCF